MRPLHTLLGVLVFLLIASPTFAQAKKLDDLFAQALKNNADVKAAELRAKRAAEEYQSICAEIRTKIAAASAEVEAALAAEREAQNRRQRIEKLYELKAASLEELGAAGLVHLKLRQERIGKEARLQELVGTPAAKIAPPAEPKK